MKTITHLFLVLLVFVGVGCNRQKTQAIVAESVEEKHWLEDLWFEDTIRFYYAKPVNGYRVEGKLFLGGGGSPSYDLIFTESVTHKSFECEGGFLNWNDAMTMFPDKERLELEYIDHNSGTYDFIDGNALFYFMDLDFDGEKELLTGLNSYHGNREDGRFGLIYKIRDGVPIDVTAEPWAKTDIFNHMDRDWFGADYKNKELHWHGGCAMEFGYTAYKFSHGNYSYDKLVSYEYIDFDKHRKTVYSPHGEIIKQYMVENYKEECEYWWSFLQKHYWCEHCETWHGELDYPVCPNSNISEQGWLDRLTTTLQAILNI